MEIGTVIVGGTAICIVITPILIYRMKMLTRYARRWIRDLDGPPLEQIEALSKFRVEDHISWRNIFDLTKWRYSDYFPPRRT